MTTLVCKPNIKNTGILSNTYISAYFDCVISNLVSCRQDTTDDVLSHAHMYAQAESMSRHGANKILMIIDVNGGMKGLQPVGIFYSIKLCKECSVWSSEPNPFIHPQSSILEYNSWAQTANIIYDLC